MNMRVGITVLCLLGVLLTNGCGYRLAVPANPLLDDIDTVAIAYLRNDTFEPGIESLFTAALVDEFVASRRLAVVAEDQADAVLRGAVRMLRDDTAVYTRHTKSLEYRVTVSLDLELVACASGAVLWQRHQLIHDEDYLVEDSIAITESNKRAALATLAADVAERVHDSILQGF